MSTAPTTTADRGHITRIEVVFKADPFSETSLNALDVVIKTVRAATAPGQPLEGTSAIGIAGSTAAVHALKLVTTSDEQRMYVLVTLGVYAILVALFRRPGISLYLIATVVLGYLASLGLTDLVFQALHRGPDPWGGLDWTVGFFLFVILVAVGEDYNILLMARVIEEEAHVRNDRRHAPRRCAHGRHHQLVRVNHGWNLRLDAHRQPELVTRARLRTGPGSAPRHVPGPPDPGAGVRRFSRAGAITMAIGLTITVAVAGPAAGRRERSRRDDDYERMKAEG